MYIKNHIKLIGAITVLLLFLSVFSNAQSPGGVSGATFWARADNGVTTSGSNVTTWTNLANTSNNLTVTSPTPPTLVSSANINFNPAVTFGGTAVAYTTGNVTPAGSSYSRFVAFKTSTTSAANILGSGFPPSTLATFSLWKPTTANTLSHWAGSNFGNASATYNTGLPNVASAVYANGVLGTYIKINGTSNTATLNSPSFATGSNVAIGGAFNTGFQNIFNGAIPEAIIYPSALTAPQVAHVESYLAIKYGITLSSNYVASNNGGAVITTWNATTNTGYNNNIAGIGRDDNTALLQKQSQSQNTGFQPIVGLGTIATTNLANTSSGFSAADRSFLIWGDNNASTSFATAISLAGINNRMARIWKVQETGTVGTVLIAIPESSVPENLSNLNVITAGNAALTIGVSASPMTLQTINSVAYYTASIDLTDGQFFTFGGLVATPGGVNGLRLWLKADAGTNGVSTDGTTLLTWNDQSGNGFDVIAPSATNQPLFRTANSSAAKNFNFNPYIDFNARGMYNASAAVFNSANDNGAVFAHAISTTIGTNGSTLIAFANNTSSGLSSYMDQGKFLLLSNTQIQWVGNDTKAFISNPSVKSSLYSANWVGATATTKTMRLSADGVGLVNDPNKWSLTWLPTTDPSNQISIDDAKANGLGDNSGSFFASEYIAFNTALSDLDLTRVNTYMAIKYGTTLGRDINGNSTLNEVISGSIREGDYVASNGSTVVWAANNTYANNIAGIGRDDNSGLLQKQSQSVNSGNQLTASIGTIAATNLANTNSITSDRQFLIWGDDAGALTMNTITGRGTYGQRFARIWKTQNTNGFAENITVYFPVSAFGNIAAANVGLVYGNTAAELSNGAGKVIPQSGTTTINGVNNYVFSVPSTEVASMQFFSFANNVQLPGGVNGATIWFKADAGVTLSGSGVTLWTNQVPNAVFTDIPAAISTALPLYSASLWNFNPGITFDGSIGGMYKKTTSMYDILGTTENESLLAIRSKKSAVYFQVNDNGNTTNRYNLESNRINFLSGVATTGIISTGASGNIGLPSLMNTSTTASPSNAIRPYLNGKLGTTATFTGALPAGTVNNINVYLGAFTSSALSNGLVLEGDLPELIHFNKSLSSTERLQVSTYLSLKYGFTIDQTTIQNYIASNGTTVIWDASTNSAYNSNFAGIGRDDFTALYQKQSTSINAGNQVVVSAGTIANTNAYNTAIFDDKQFFVWGDDNASLIPRTLTNKPLSPRRFARVWRTQNTNNFNQSIKIYYPVNGFSNAVPSSVALIYGTNAAALSDGSGDLIGQSGTTTINGLSYYVFNVTAADLNRLQFFSFASNPAGPGGVIGHTLWLKANDLSYTDGTAINATNLWTAATGNSAGPIANGTSPTFKLNSWNFNPVVRFNAGGIGADYANIGTSITAITVLNVKSNSLINGGIGARALSLARNFAPDDNNLCMIPLRGTTGSGLETATNGGSVTAGFSGSVVNGNSQGIAISMRTPATGFASGNLANRLMAQWNGYVSAFSASTSFSSLSAYNIDYYVLGGMANGSKTINTNGLLTGDIPEVAIYNFDLSDTERIQVNSYLAIKYGVTLDNAAFGIDYLASDGTTVIWPSTANSTYKNNVAGIGRDDASVLNQKQSMSINTGDQLVVSLGTAQATNEANTNTFAADKRFLIWGDNAGSLAAVNDSAIPRLSGANLLKRLGRIWKIQNTNAFNQSITVYFPTAALTSAFGTASPYLIYDDQADFKGSVKQLVTSSGTQVINGNSYTAFTFTVPSTPANLFLTFSGYYIQSMVNPANTIGIQNGRIKY